MTIAVTQEMLNEAVTAYHTVMTGGVAKFRDQNGEEITYSRVDAPKLWAYIEWIKGQLNPTSRCNNGPMTVWM